MVQEFNAIAFETEREQKFKQSRSIKLEISSYHNYFEGITYQQVYAGDLEIGEYYRHPWGSGWYWRSSITGDKAHCPNKAIALSNIQRHWMRWSA